MKCKNCGTESTSTDQYCMVCGALLQKHEQKTNKSKKKLLMIIITEILLIACAIAAILIVPGMRKEKHYDDLLVSAQRYFELLDYEKAEALYLEAISIAPKKETPYLRLADIYMEQGEGEKAKNILREGYEQTGNASLHEKYKECKELIEKEKAKEEASSVLINEKAPYAQDGYCHSYRLGSAVSYDLNGDGVEENIQVSLYNEYYSRISINGIVNVSDTSLAEPTGYFTIINIHGTGNELLIGISEYGPSADYATYLYAFNGNQIIEVGMFDDILGETEYYPGNAKCNGDGTISAHTRMDVLGTWEAEALYAYENDTLMNITEYYRYVGYGENVNEWEATTKYGIDMYEGADRGYAKVRISQGTVVYMLGCKRDNENECWVEFRLGTSEQTVWLPVETSGWPCMVETSRGKVASEEVFEGYYYAG